MKLISRVFKKVSITSSFARPIALLLGLCTLGISSLSFADDAITIAGIATNMQSTVASAVDIAIMIAIAVGITLVVVGIVKLKAHKDQPTQIPLSTGLMYICVGAALTMVPALIPTFNQALVGTSSTAQVDGSDINALIGASSTGGQ
jgi:intracellular multiplication protein IcmD